MRILPRSLKGQLILLTLVALLFSQVASFLFMLDDHKSRRKHAWLNILERIATVKDVIEATPSGLHARIVKSANLSALKFTIAPNPAVIAAEETAGANLQDQIERAFGESAS